MCFQPDERSDDIGIDTHVRSGNFVAVSLTSRSRLKPVGSLVKGLYVELSMSIKMQDAVSLWFEVKRSIFKPCNEKA